MDSVILFNYHELTPVVLQHFHYARKHNPGVPIFPISNGIGHAPLPMNFDASNAIAGWEVREGAHLSGDIFYYRWYLATGVRARRYIWMEYDVLCLGSARDLMAPVWNVDLAAANVFSRNRGDEWPWFQAGMKEYPEQYRRNLWGIMPLGLALVSDRLMHALATHPLHLASNSELRVATVAAVTGMSPVEIPDAKATISWKPGLIPAPSSFETGKIYHPVKSFYSPGR